MIKELFGGLIYRRFDIFGEIKDGWDDDAVIAVAKEVE